MLSQLVALLVGRRSRFLILAFGVVVIAVFGPLGGKQDLTDDPTAFLPANAPSTAVVRLQERLPGGQETPAIVVFSSVRPLTSKDRALIETDVARFRQVAERHQVVGPTFSSDRRGALVVVALSSTGSSAELSASVARLREITANRLGPGLSGAVGGPAGYVVDLTGAFGGIDSSLLFATIAVVALVLIVTYRSPLLWLVPLAVIGIADQTASGIVYLLAHAGHLVVNGESSGILRVLVFGAGTDYALLLIARYREELRTFEDRFAAMRAALTGTFTSIIASAATVTISLCVLGSVSSLNNDRSLGFVGAIGIATAVLFALGLLPAVLVLFDRKLFWPIVPQVGTDDPTRTGTWSRIAARVTRTPGAFATAVVLLLGLGASGLFGLHTGLTQAQQFRDRVPSTTAANLIAAHFPAGASATTTVIANRSAATAVLRAVDRTPGVASGVEATETSRYVEFDATLAASPDSPQSFRTIESLRERLSGVPGASALVGGSIATDLDTDNAARHDTAVVIPAVLAVVLVILILLLRSLLGPVLLIATVLASYAASVGASRYLFTRILGYPDVDASFPLLAFLFLVAFGVDYNIFLVGRARQEAIASGTVDGARTALALTGGVITSAGVVLAATFSVLTILPLQILTEIGIVVALGVLVDTVLVRSLLVPAIIAISRDRFWWPGSIARATTLEGR